MKIATVVLVKNNQILLIKKSTNRYSMPGGKVEAFESPIQAAKREVLEETGLLINKLELLSVANIYKSNLLMEMYTFFTSKFDGEIMSSVEGEIEWIDINKLDDLYMYPSDQEIINHCINNYLIKFSNYKY